MKLCEVLTLTPNPTIHPEITYPNQYDNKNYGKKNKKFELRDVIVRSSKTGTIYGRRTIAQGK